MAAPSSHAVVLMRPFLPPDWETGFNGGTICTVGLYVMRRMPALYLLDGRHQVVAKELPPEQLAGLIDGTMRTVRRSKQTGLP